MTVEAASRRSRPILARLQPGIVELLVPHGRSLRRPLRSAAKSQSARTTDALETAVVAAEEPATAAVVTPVATAVEAVAVATAPQPATNWPQPVWHAAPLRRMDKSWLSAWAVLLSAYPQVSASPMVSALLHSVPQPAHDPAPARFLPRPVAPAQTSRLHRSRARGAMVAATRDGSNVPFPLGRSIGGQVGDAGLPRRRTVELLAALSAGLDAAENRVRGQAPRTAVLAAQIGLLMDRSEHMRASLLYAGLLRDAGTTGRTGTPRRLPRSRSRSAAPRADRVPAHLSRPDRAAAVIRALGLPIEVAEAVCSADERWDGKGPMQMREHQIPLGGRALAVASVAAEAAGREIQRADRSEVSRERAVSRVRREITDALREGQGGRLDPELVKVLLRDTSDAFWTRLITVDPMIQLLEAEPAGDIRRSTAEHIDTVCATFADLIDTRTPEMGRHGVHMARLAERVAARLGFDDAECRELRRAGLLAHIGKLVVPISTLEKPRKLSTDEKAMIATHPRVGADILRRSRVLAGLAPLIESQSEPLDGTGHFPSFGGERMALAARILAVCDRYEAMTSPRAYRPAKPRSEAWKLLEAEATEPLARQALSALRMVVEPN